MSKRLRIVFDTQIFLRALINRNSVCAKISTLPLRDHYTLYVFDKIEAEVREVLNRESVRSKFPKITDEQVEITLHFLRERAERVQVGQIESISRDPKDDIFLACAKAANADYLVSEDNDLLVLGSYEGTRIVNALQFLAILEAR